MEENLQEAHWSFGSLNQIAGSVASAILVVYGIGFVILSFSDARYGVVQFSPFRARIILVGFVFVMLIALAAAAQHYGLAYFEPFEHVMADKEPSRTRAREIVLASGFIFTASLISGILGTFLFHGTNYPQTPPWSLWKSVLWSLPLLLGIGFFYAAARFYFNRTWLAILFSLFAVAMYIVTLVRWSGPSSYLTVTLFLAGWQTTWVKREGNLVRYLLDFRNWYFFLAITWLYIGYVFVALPPRWGGGQPTPIELFLNSQPAWSQSNPTDALLLDETEDGLYVLLSPAGKAFFVPRGNISSVFFGSQQDLRRSSGAAGTGR